MRIGEFAQKSGVPVDTLRYYEKLGLLSPAKTHQRRHYTEEDLRKVQAIIKLKRLNFRLEEIRHILELDRVLDQTLAQGERNLKLAQEEYELLQAKYAEILYRERELLEIKGQLEQILEKLERFLEGGL